MDRMLGGEVEGGSGGKLRCGFVVEDPAAAYSGDSTFQLSLLTLVLSLCGVLGSVIVLLTITFIYPRAAADSKGLFDFVFARCRPDDATTSSDKPTQHDARDEAAEEGGRSVVYFWMVYVMAWVNLIGEFVVVLASVLGMFGLLQLRYSLAATVEASGNWVKCAGASERLKGAACTSAAYLISITDTLSFIWAVAVGIIAVAFLKRKWLLEKFRCVVQGVCCVMCCSCCRDSHGGRRRSTDARSVESEEEEEEEEDDGRVGVGGDGVGDVERGKSSRSGEREEDGGDAQSSFVSIANIIGLSVCFLIAVGSSTSLAIGSFTKSEGDDGTHPDIADRTILSVGGFCSFAHTSNETAFSTTVTWVDAIVALVCFVLVGNAAATAVVPKRREEEHGEGGSLGQKVLGGCGWCTCDPEWHAIFCTAMFGNLWQFCFCARLVLPCLCPPLDHMPLPGRLLAGIRSTDDLSPSTSDVETHSPLHPIPPSPTTSHFTASRPPLPPNPTHPSSASPLQTPTTTLPGVSHPNPAQAMMELIRKRTIESPRAAAVLQGIAPLRFYPLIIVAFSIVQFGVNNRLQEVSSVEDETAIWPVTTSTSHASWERSKRFLNNKVDQPTSNLLAPDYGGIGHIANLTQFPAPLVSRSAWRACMQDVSFVGVDHDLSFGVGKTTIGACTHCDYTLPDWVDDTDLRSKYNDAKQFLCKERDGHISYQLFVPSTGHQQLKNLIHVANTLNSTTSSASSSLFSFSSTSSGIESGRGGAKVQRSIVVLTRVVQTGMVAANAIVFFLCTPALWQFAARLGRALREDAENEIAEREEEKSGDGGDGVGGGGEDSIVTLSMSAPGGQTAGKGGSKSILEPPNAPIGWSVASSWGLCCVGGCLLPTYLCLGCIERGDLNLQEGESNPRCACTPRGIRDNLAPPPHPLLQDDSTSHRSSVGSTLGAPRRLGSRRRETGAPLPARPGSRNRSQDGSDSTRLSFEFTSSQPDEEVDEF